MDTQSKRPFSIGALSIFSKMFSKSWIGFKEMSSLKSVKHMGDRKTAILCPTDGNKCKKMRVTLGCCVFFLPSLPNYSNKTKHLSD